MNGMNGMGGGKMSGHMATCPLCRGTGAVPVEVAEAADVAPAGPAPANALASAMGGGMKRGGHGGSHSGHGGM